MLVCGIALAGVLTLSLCTIVHAQKQQPDRVRHPIVVKLGMEGLGLDVTVMKPLAVDVTYAIFYLSSKLRVLLLSDNATPYVGVGIGGWGEPGGGGNNWTVVHAGWEVSGKSIFFQFYFQYPVLKENTRQGPYPIGFNFGYRF